MMTETRPALGARISEIVCRDCGTFPLCLENEIRHRDLIKGRKGNYRGVFLNGKLLRSPVRYCVDTIFKQHQNDFIKKDVLEIGCGKQSPFTENYIKQHQIRYVAIDPENIPRRGLPLFKNRSLLLQSINWPIRAVNRLYGTVINQWHGMKSGARAHYLRASFPSQRLNGHSFDVIYASESIEHWHENLPGSSSDPVWDGSREAIDDSLSRYRQDIEACQTLLKPGGKLLMDCPIHLHGNVLFFRGYLQEIMKIFQSLTWSSLEFWCWRRSHDGLSAYMPEDVRGDFSNYGKPMANKIWILNILATK